MDRRLVLATALFLLLGACSSGTTPAASGDAPSEAAGSVKSLETPGTGASTPEPTATATSTPSTEPGTGEATPAAATTEPERTAGQPCGPGAAWIASFGEGAACVDGDGWKAYDKTNSPLTIGQVQDVAVCSDGVAWLADTSGLVSLDGDAWTSYAQATEYKGFEAIACDPAGGVWLAGFDVVARFDGSAMETYPVADLGTGKNVRLVKDIAVAADGAVWAITANSVAVFDGTKWTYFEEGKGFSKEYYMEKLAVDGAGRVWVGTSSTGVLMYDGKKWTEYSQSSLFQVKAIVVDARDRVWVGTYSKGVSMYDGKKWVTYGREDDALPSNSATALAADAKGRLWVGTQWGLAVLEGTDWRWIHVHDSGMLDDEVSALAVDGRGPALPEPVEKAPGTLTGRIVKGGDPQAGLTVEACVEFVGGLYSGETPCSDQPFHPTVKTDGEGRFTFEDMPVGMYAITVRRGADDWIRLTDGFKIGDREVTVEEGGTTDIGEIDIASVE